MKIFNLALLLLLQMLFACNESPELKTSAAIKGTVQKPIVTKPGTASLIFSSADGGQSWHNISEGLPGEKLQGSLFVNDEGIHVRTGHHIYHHKPGSKEPFWEKESFPDDHSLIAPGRAGMYAYDYHLGQFRQKLNGLSIWSSVFQNFELRGIIDVFETSKGSVFIVCDRGRGLYRSADNGKTWKEVHRGVWQMAESNGVLVANSINGMIRSADDGETWEPVNAGGDMGVRISSIEGGFAAITHNRQSDTRRVRISYDGGQNWQAIDGSLPRSMKTSSIIQAGSYFFCGHPDGIFRSGDKGKTWQLVLSTIKGKVYNLSVSGDVVYAVPSEGC